LLNSNHNVITGNKIFNNNYSGLEFMDSSSNIVTDNTLKSNSLGGITIRESTYNKLSNNAMSSSSIFINGEWQDQWDTHTIDTMNTVNGKPVYFWKNKVGGTVPAGAGEVILVNCKYVNITNQDLSGGSTGIELAFSSNNIIDNNEIINNILDGIYLISSDNNLLTNNTCTNNTEGIYLIYSDDNKILTNNCSINRGTGISILQSRRNWLDNNTCSFNGYKGIKIEYLSIDSTIKNNICNSNGNDGIGLIYRSNTRWIKNNILNFNKNHGMGIYDTHYTTIKNNSCISNKFNGITLYQSYHNVLLKNNLNSNGQHGLYFNFCEDNEVFSNIMSYNLNSGIYLSESRSSNFINNSVSYNEFGFYLDESRYNRIYHNRFIDNTNQAFETDRNYWDYSYSNGGNYWSDYTGKDEFNGYKQDVPGKDGLGDTQYPIQGYTDNDDYPLMNANYPLPPSAPRNLKYSYGDVFINLSWDPPAYDGDFPIIEYKINKKLIKYDYEESIILDNITYFNDTLVNYGEKYEYSVNAINIFGYGPSSSRINVTLVTVPFWPENVDIHIYPEALKLRWSRPSDRGSPITNYRVYRGLDLENITFLTEIGNVLFYNDTDILKGETYYYRVSAMNEVGESRLSSVIYSTAMDVPEEPKNFKITSEDLYILLTWHSPYNNGGSPVINFRIYRSTEPDIDLFFEEIGTKTEYRDTSMTPGLRYYYRVSAVNEIGEGEKSVKVMGFIPGFPQAPLNISAKTGDSFVNLTWSEPEFDGGYPIERYYVYRGTTPGEENAIDKVWNDTFFFNDTNLINGEVYYYKLCASNDYGRGPFTRTIRVIPEKTEIIITVNEAPKAQIVFHIYNATWKVPLTVNFNGSGFDTDGTIVSYLWDFGDGNKSTEQDPVHKFTSPGTYFVKLTVMDDDGDLDVAMVTIVVEPEHDERVDDPDKKIQDEEENKGAFWLLVAGGALSLVIAFFIMLFAIWPILIRNKTIAERERQLKEVKVFRTQMRAKTADIFPEREGIGIESEEKHMSEEIEEDEAEE
jgi:parallel beta-helix repeat protein